MLVRDCALNEAEAVVGVWRAAYAPDPPHGTRDEVVRLIAQGPGFLLVAEVEGRIVGALIAAFDGWRGNMYGMAVRPEYQRRGVARALAEEAEARLASQGCRRITALVVKDHPWATGFWTAAGYELTDSMGRYVHNLPAGGAGAER